MHQSWKETNPLSDCPAGTTPCFRDCCHRGQFCNAKEERCQHCETREIYCGNETLLPQACDVHCLKKNSLTACPETNVCVHPAYFWSTWILTAFIVLMLMFQTGRWYHQQKRKKLGRRQNSQDSPTETQLETLLSDRNNTDEDQPDDTTRDSTTENECEPHSDQRLLPLGHSTGNGHLVPSTAVRAPPDLPPLTPQWEPLTPPQTPPPRPSTQNDVRATAPPLPPSNPSHPSSQSLNLPGSLPQGEGRGGLETTEVSTFASEGKKEEETKVKENALPSSGYQQNVSHSTEPVSTVPYVEQGFRECYIASGQAVNQFNCSAQDCSDPRLKNVNPAADSDNFFSVHRNEI